MRVWVTFGILSLQASLSLAADLTKVTPSTFPEVTFPEFSMDEIALGRDLFYDPILSGNRNISCATCHHPTLGTSDGMSLSIGQGGHGLGPNRVADKNAPPRARIPRNAPALWNVGATEYVTLFHDGRGAIDPVAPFGVKMPKGRALERPMASPLAAQAILPILSPEEMAGHADQNLIGLSVSKEQITGPGGAWAQLAERVEGIETYKTAFDKLRGRDESLHISEIGNALAAFMTFEFRATSAPFDAFLAGQSDALSDDQRAGMDLFYGKANCGTCHSGALQTDHQFHSIGVPQLGPGKLKAPEGEMAGYADPGRELVTGKAEDMYRFRTPSLRNVTQTAPYGHSGAYASLDAMVRHHLDPVSGLLAYNRAQAFLHELQTSSDGQDIDDWGAMENQDDVIDIAASIEIAPVALSPMETAQILAFLAALTDDTAARGRLGVPETVPSGLPVDR